MISYVDSDKGIARDVLFASPSCCECERVWSGGARVKKWKSEKPDTASGQRVKTVASVWSCLAKANFIINEDVSSKLVFILIHKFIVTKLNSTSTSHISIMTQANTPTSA